VSLHNNLPRQLINRHIPLLNPQRSLQVALQQVHIAFYLAHARELLVAAALPEEVDGEFVAGCAD